MYYSIIMGDLIKKNLEKPDKLIKPKEINEILKGILIAYFGLKNWKIIEYKCRKRELVTCRVIFGVLMKKYTKKSLSKIGSYIKRDHAMILHYEKKHNDLYETCKEYRYDFNYVENELIKMI